MGEWERENGVEEHEDRERIEEREAKKKKITWPNWKSHRKLARRAPHQRAARERRCPSFFSLPRLSLSLSLSANLSLLFTQKKIIQYRNHQVHNESGSKRVIVTKGLPGDRWLKLLTDAGARVEVCTSADTILSVPQIKSLIGDKCDGVIGQLTEVRMNGEMGESRVSFFLLLF